MVAAADLSGIRFGKLVALHRVPSTNGHARWKLLCDCGQAHEAAATALKGERVSHCGCSPHSRTHGLTKTRIHRVWRAMKQRCNNPNNGEYGNYGARGITVCAEWSDNFEAFLAWALAHGYDGILEIDRIDVNRGYSPGNCRFVTSSVNKRNMRKTRYYFYDGQDRALPDIADMTGINVRTLRSRINIQKMTIEEAITIPRNVWATRRLRSPRSC